MQSKEEAILKILRAKGVQSKSPQTRVVAFTLLLLSSLMAVMALWATSGSGWSARPQLNATRIPHDANLTASPSTPLHVLEPVRKNPRAPCHLTNATISPHNVLLHHVLCFGPQSSRDMISFNGPKVKTILDTNNEKPHVLLSNKAKLRSWSGVIALINRTASEARALQNNTGGRTRTMAQAVHLHNELQLGDLLLLLVHEYAKGTPRGRVTPKLLTDNVLVLSTATVHHLMGRHQPPVVITNSADENWGFLSTGIGTRTTKWINMTNHLKIHHSDYNTVKSFLSSDRVALLVCSQHVDPQIGSHEKILALPLGVKARSFLLDKAREIFRVGVEKTSDLYISNSGWGDRAKINEMVSKAFNYTVNNSYSATKIRNAGLRKVYTSPFTNRSIRWDHFVETAQAKFVLCPSGLGIDTYRLWETIFLGSIPVVESNKGFDRTYSNLPVLVLLDYNELTPQLLEKAYPCFLRHAPLFEYKHLSESHWLQLIDSALQTGSIADVDKEHPREKHKYCDFLSRS